MVDSLGESLLKYFENKHFSLVDVKLSSNNCKIIILYEHSYLWHAVNYLARK